MYKRKIVLSPTRTTNPFNGELNESIYFVRERSVVGDKNAYSLGNNLKSYYTSDK